LADIWVLTVYWY